MKGILWEFQILSGYLVQIFIDIVNKNGKIYCKRKTIKVFYIKFNKSSER